MLRRIFAGGVHIHHQFSVPLFIAQPFNLLVSALL